VLALVKMSIRKKLSVFYSGHGIEVILHLLCKKQDQGKLLDHADGLARSECPRFIQRQTIHTADKMDIVA
jgi:hypothetical protein